MNIDEIITKWKEPLEYDSFGPLGEMEYVKLCAIMMEVQHAFDKSNNKTIGQNYGVVLIRSLCGDLSSGSSSELLECIRWILENNTIDYEFDEEKTEELITSLEHPPVNGQDIEMLLLENIRYELDKKLVERVLNKELKLKPFIKIVEIEIDRTVVQISV